MSRDWRAFTERIFINAPAEEVARAWMTSGGLMRWFVPTAEFIDEAGQQMDEDLIAEPTWTYRWCWAEGTQDTAHVMEVDFPNMNRYGWYHDDGEVLVRITQEGTRTLVELTQDMKPLGEDLLQEIYVGCSQGWAFYLTNLKSVLEGGLDLRELHEPSRANLVNV